MKNEARITRLSHVLQFVEHEIQQLKKDLYQQHVHVNYETSFATIDYDATIVDVFEDYGTIFFKVRKDDGTTTSLDSADCVFMRNYDED